MIHHVREIRLRLFIVVLVLLAGMAVGYFFYEPLFHFIKSPLEGSLHYTSPSGSFTFVIKICLMVGIIAALPVAVYNLIMFVQPALKKRLSRLRVYVTTLLSLALSVAGAAFAFLIIIPLALRFFYKFQVDGLVALISADDYLRFVVGVVITFVIMFQLPLLISVIDHIRPLPPMKLLKAEKYIIVGSVAIGVLVPFALDPVVQLLIASPIIVLYNVAIGIVVLQQYARSRRDRRMALSSDKTAHSRQEERTSLATTTAVRPSPMSTIASNPMSHTERPRTAVVPPAVAHHRQQVRPLRSATAVRPVPKGRLISDMRRPSTRPSAPRSGAERAIYTPSSITAK